MRVLKLVIVFYVFLLFSPTVARSQAFSWQDPSGTTFFGSNPPPDALHVKKLQGRSFSRYSSDKVIKGYNRKSTAGSGARLKETDLLQTDAPTTGEIADNTEDVDSADRPGPRARLLETPETITGGAASAPALEQGKITVTHDANQWVTACKVVVRNTGRVAAQKVLVSFEFEDGTIVPARGPEVLAPKGESVYFIAPESLPVKVNYQRPAKTVTGISYQQLPRPKVIIQASPFA